MSNRTTRRTFIQQAALAGAALPVAMPGLVRAASANDKLNIACVGTANQARFSINNIGSENIVAFADVDANYLQKAKSDYPKANTYEDYREMIDREQGNIDAVVVATPDHHHAHAALRAMNLGKHVYCEKPLAHTVEEVRLMKEAAKRNNVATQMGTQIHATDHYRRMVELIQSGTIGPVREVHIWQGGFYSGSRFPDDATPVPDHLNWDLWLGPAAERDYHPKIYHPAQWRGWWGFGGGMLADIACHVLDLAHWALDLRYPETVEATAADPMELRAPRSLMVEYHYPARGGKPPVKFMWYDGGKHIEAGILDRFNIPEDWRSGRNILFVGDDGMILTDYSRHRLLPEEKFSDHQPPQRWIRPSIGHHDEWIRACKEGTPTLCNFDYSGTLAETVLLGTVAHRAGNIKLEYDSETGRVTNDDNANEFITKPYRKGWEINRLT